MKHIFWTVSFIFFLALCPINMRAQNDGRLVHEALVNAPVDRVWAVLTTKEGMESWMTAHAAVELKVGGTMKSQYDPKGTVDDASAIENTILSYDPMSMLSFKVTRTPDGFPFPNAIKNMWTVVYFIPEGSNMTRVREISMGFGKDDESKKMREFFDRGNAYTMQKLQERFPAKVGGN